MHVHVDELEELMLPAGQTLHCDAVAALYWPAGQAVMRKKREGAKEHVSRRNSFLYCG